MQLFFKYSHSAENEAVFISVVVPNDNVVVEYAHLEDRVVCTDAQIRDCHNAHKLNIKAHS